MTSGGSLRRGAQRWGKAPRRVCVEPVPRRRRDELRRPELSDRCAHHSAVERIRPGRLPSRLVAYAPRSLEPDLTQSAARQQFRRQPAVLGKFSNGARDEAARLVIIRKIKTLTCIQFRANYTIGFRQTRIIAGRFDSLIA